MLWILTSLGFAEAIVLSLGSAPEIYAASAALGAIIGAIVLRWLLRAVRHRGGQLMAASAQSDGLGQPSSRDPLESRYLVPRLFYYAGMLTIAQTVLRVGGFTPSDWIFLVGLIALIFEMFLLQEVPPPFFGALGWGIGLLALGGLISSFDAKDFQESVLAVAKYIYLLVMWFWFGAVVLRNADQVRVAMSCWVASVAVSGLYAIGQILFGFPALNDITAYGRATGLNEHFNELGMICAMALPVAVMFIGHASRLWYRAFYAALTLCILLGLFFSVSLAALAGAAVAGLVWLTGLATLSAGSKWRLAAFGAVLALGAAYLSSLQELGNLPNFVDRMEHLNELRSRNDSMDARMATYRAAWEEVRDHPLIGVGLDAASATTQAGNQVHNVLLINWYEGGILALAGIIIVLLSIAWLDWFAAIHAATYQQWWLTIGVSLAGVVFLVAGMAGPVAHTRDIWTFGALALALYSVIGKTRVFAVEA